jgi:prephenate dehydrogenase
MNIGIIGTGLIGGSLAASLVGKINYKIFCYNRRIEVSKKALELGVVDNFFESIGQLTQNCDVIIFATPLNTYGAIAAEISKYLSEQKVDNQKVASQKINCQKIISDVGSVKFLPSEEVLNNLPANLQNIFVPAHPIAGSEKTGVEAADKNLFIGKKLIVTKLPNTDENKANIIAQIWQDAGAKVIYLEPETHDKIYAKVSHLPQLLSFIYKKVFAIQPFKSPEGPEYKEFTRLCNSDENLWADIFKYNHAQIVSSIKQYKVALAKNKNLENIPKILAQSLEDIILSNEKDFGGTGLKSFLTPLNFEFQNQEKSVINSFLNEFITQIEAYENI